MEQLQVQVASFFASEGIRTGLSGVNGSRRVILYGLPAGASLGSVLEAVSAPSDPEANIRGGIVSADIFIDPVRPEKKSRTVMVEFISPFTASEYVKNVEGTDVYLHESVDIESGSRTRLRAYLAPSNSNNLSPETIFMLLANKTRSLVIPVCPPELVWDLLCAIGAHLITNASYDHESGALTLEFVSIFEADRAYGLLTSGYCPEFAICELLPPRFTSDSTQRAFSTILTQVITNRPGEFGKTFNQTPFFPSFYSPQRDWKPFFRPSLIHSICLSNDLHPFDLIDWLEERRTFDTSTIKIIGSNITVAKEAYAWDIDDESRIKLLLATSLSDPNLEEAWDDYFRVRRLPNLRRYEEYRALCAENVNDYQSGSTDEDTETSDNEAWSAESSAGEQSSFTDSSTPTASSSDEFSSTQRVPCNKVITSSAGPLQRSARYSQLCTGINMPWLTPQLDSAPIPKGSSCQTGPLICGIEDSESISGSIEEYEDWLWSHGEPVNSDAAEMSCDGELADLIRFGIEDI